VSHELCSSELIEDIDLRWGRRSRRVFWICHDREQTAMALLRNTDRNRLTIMASDELRRQIR
jgi:hypothetical protein